MAIRDLPKRIQEHIMEKTARSDKEQAINRMGVTELLGCQRKAYFRRTDPLPIGVEQSFIFFRGQVFDEAFTTLFPRNQVRVTHRIRDTPIVISGRFDFVDEDGAVADWKTIDGTYWIESKGAKEENVIQVLFYCYCEGVNKGRLYYMSLGNVIKIDIDANEKAQREVIEILEERAKNLYDSLVYATVPDIDSDHSKDFWECKYTKGQNEVRCEYYDRCYGDEK